MPRITHGYTKRGARPPEYLIWGGMLKRCLDEKDGGQLRYGGRGIRVCDRWKLGEDNLSAYECFLFDIGPRPSPKHSVERRDNDKGYEPSNCYWATWTEQQRNRSSNRMILYRGQMMPLTAAAELANLNPATVFGRLNLGWTDDEAINTPFDQIPHTRKRRKLKFDQAVEMSVRRLRGEKCRILASDYGVGESLPGEIIRGQCWADALAKAKQIIADPFLLAIMLKARS